MKINKILIAAYILFGIKISAQVTFEKNYGNMPIDIGKDIERTHNAKYFYVSAQKIPAGWAELNLTILDSIGNFVWDTVCTGQSTISNQSSSIEPFSIQKTSDKGFLIFCNSVICPNITCENRLYLMKVDSNGHKQWIKIHNPIYYNFTAQQQTADGGYAVVGVAGAGQGSILLKIDPSGNIQWQKTYSYSSGQGYLNLVSVQQTSDGGYIMTGGGKFASAHLLICKTNSLGDSLWTKSYGNYTNTFNGKSILVDSDGGFIIAGDTSVLNGTKDIFLLKTDNTGQFLWSKKYGGSADENVVSIKKTSDGGYVILSNTKSFGNGGSDIYLTKTDALGNSKWTKTFGNSLNDEALSIRQTYDGGFVIIGSTEVSSNNKNVYIIKTDSLGNNAVGLSENKLDNNSIIFYPNPTNGIINVELGMLNGASSASAAEVQIQIINTLGQVVIKETTMPNIKNLTLNINNFSQGLYFLRVIRGGNIIANQKIIKE